MPDIALFCPSLLVWGLMVAIAMLLSGCESSPKQTSRYSMEQDVGPEQAVDLSHVKDAVPRSEPYSAGGNRSPYTVWGESYLVMASAQGYREQGIASWYGRKFHGHATSNGEIYDMYAMTAAHKALPLPSFARVTNQANGRSVVVRVNDRGPFHEDRLIDLSYAAAHRLGMLRAGTARVLVEAITPEPIPLPLGSRAANTAAQSATADAQLVTRHLQIGAYSTREAAEKVRQRVVALLPQWPVAVSERDGAKTLYRVRLGPLPAQASTDSLIEQLQQAGFHAPRVVDLP